MAAGRISVCLGKTSRSPRRGARQDKCWHPEVVSGDAATEDGAARGWGSLHSPLLVAPELCEHEDGVVPMGGAHPSPGCCQPTHPPCFVSGSRPGRPLRCQGLSWLRAVIWHARAKQHQIHPEESSSQQQWWGARTAGAGWAVLGGAEQPGHQEKVGGARCSCGASGEMCIQTGNLAACRAQTDALQIHCGSGIMQESALLWCCAQVGRAARGQRGAGCQERFSFKSCWQQCRPS